MSGRVLLKSSLYSVTMRPTPLLVSPVLIHHRSSADRAAWLESGRRRLKFNQLCTAYLLSRWIKAPAVGGMFVKNLPSVDEADR